MAVDDGRVEHEHWRGAIALKLVLHPDEVTTVPPPDPLFVLAPRLGYLPQVSQQALEQFGGALPPGANEPWFEYRGVPLKWHLPTGALYDLLSDGEYPWKLTIHFRAYPRDVLQPVRGSVEETLQATYLNSLKEAAYVLTGNSNAVMSLSKKSQQELLQNVLEAQQVEFHQNMQKMDLTKPLKARVPVRIYAREKVFDSFTGWKSIDYASKSLHIEGESSGDSQDHLSVKHVLQHSLSNVSDGDLESVKVVVAGVEIDLDSNLAEVYAYLKNADLWLYVTVILKPKRTSAAAGTG
mmetsp:Transcript_14673/g.37131  ORF Transcript_14673/g.37131 Transcript_14673/m.37131 type:complete len:295 (-) Transcript_14673:104-988(-)